LIPVFVATLSPCADGSLMCRPCPSKNYRIMRLLTNTSIENPPAFTPLQSHPVIEARKPLLFIDLCWCGESNPQDPKVGGF
jgi:hypothetical protein